MSNRERFDVEVLPRRAQEAVLSGLARGNDVYDLMAAAEPSHVPGLFTPSDALLELVVTALDLACPTGAEPLEYQGLRERCLPEVRPAAGSSIAIASRPSTPPPPACVAAYGPTC